MRIDHTVKTPRICFSTPYGPYGKYALGEDPVDQFYYRNTFGQKVFALKQVISWHPLHLIAQNIPAQSTILENPSLRKFSALLKREKFDAFCFAYTIATSFRILEMVQLIRESPNADADIILGGYGNLIFREVMSPAPELLSLGVQLCEGEGVAFMREYLHRKLGLSSKSNIQQDLIPSQFMLFRSKLPLFKQHTLALSLGCPNACNFCASSAFFRQKKEYLLSPDQLYTTLKTLSKSHPDISGLLLLDENFLGNKVFFKRWLELLDADSEFPLLEMTVFSSAKEVQSYDPEDLLRARIATIYIGVESFCASVLAEQNLSKRQGHDIFALTENLRRHGISIMGVLIVGWDAQTEESLHNDASEFIRLNPEMYQVIPLHPVPGTKLWEKMKKENRIRPDYSYRNEHVGKINFIPQGLKTQHIENIDRKIYKGLTNEGGPWPLRLLLTAISGYLHSRSKSSASHRRRQKSLKSRIFILLPLACTSLIFFTSQKIRRRVLGALKTLMALHPVPTLFSLLVSIPLGFLLRFYYLWAQLSSVLLPFADEPSFRAYEYAAQKTAEE